MEVADEMLRKYLKAPDNKTPEDSGEGSLATLCCSPSPVWNSSFLYKGGCDGPGPWLEEVLCEQTLLLLLNEHLGVWVLRHMEVQKTTTETIPVYYCTSF
ncbi:uncharacterized protein LOC144341317 isoform X2 [Macaca mulatta]